MVRKKLGKGRKNRCRFCTKEGCPRPAFVDYKDVQTLKKLCTNQGKLFKVPPPSFSQPMGKDAAASDGGDGDASHARVTRDGHAICYDASIA